MRTCSNKSANSTPLANKFLTGTHLRLYNESTLNLSRELFFFYLPLILLLVLFFFVNWDLVISAFTRCVKTRKLFGKLFSARATIGKYYTWKTLRTLWNPRKVGLLKSMVNLCNATWPSFLLFNKRIFFCKLYQTGVSAKQILTSLKSRSIFILHWVFPFAVNHFLFFFLPLECEFSLRTWTSFRFTSSFFVKSFEHKKEETNVIREIFRHAGKDWVKRKKMNFHAWIFSLSTLLFHLYVRYKNI